MILKRLFWVFIAMNFVYGSEKKRTYFDSNLEYYFDSLPMGKLTRVSSKACNNCYCGQANRVLRIVGGSLAEVNQYPWMVMLLRKTNFFCGGSLINDRYIATAAHCVVRKNETLAWVVRDVRVVLSEHDVYVSDETKSEIHGVSEVLVHPKFSPLTLDSDIALLRLDKTITFRPEITPVCLPPPGKNFVGEMATVTGWGATKEKGAPSAILRKAEVPIFSNAQCRSKGYHPSRITENMLCAGDYRGRDSCQGDSGGPLILPTSQGQMFLAGIVSWGQGCGRPNNPGVYTRVNNFLDWIVSSTKDACYCY